MAEQDVARGVVGKILGDLVERLVDDLVIVLLDLVGLLIYIVCGRGHGRRQVSDKRSLSPPSLLSKSQTRSFETREKIWRRTYR